MSINCAHGKGIKFVRDELKFFAKTHIHSEGGNIFKSIVLLNADKLTMDAQSALRRCIELFSHNTRFFMVVENKYKLLKPILSRFCEIYVPLPIINGNPINIYKYNLSANYDLAKVRNEWLKKELIKCAHANVQLDGLVTLSTKLYEKGYSGLDLIQLFETAKFIESLMITTQKYKLLLIFDRVKHEFRNEKLLILFILNFMFLNNSYIIDHISVSKMLAVI
jgi:DNA polymerase III delta prime subunit